MRHISAGPQCKYCKTTLKVVDIGTSLPGAPPTFRLSDPALVCPICDAPGKLPPPREELGRA